MNLSLSHIVNLGIRSDQELLQQRRVRLLNTITLIAGSLCLFFMSLDLFLKVYPQAIMNLSAILFVVIPVLYMNHKGKYLIARTYFIIMALLFLTSVSAITIQQLRDTDTENILIGFSVLIIVLYDNPQKTLFFSIAVISLLALKTLKHQFMGLSFDGDFALLIINLFVSFLCVYLFTGVFKNDLLIALDRLEDTNNKLKNQQEEIIEQRNDLVASKHLLRSMINNVPLFMAMVGKDGRYLVVNAKYEDAFGLPIDQIEGQHYKDILPENILTVHNPLIEQCFKGEVTEFNESVELPTGEVFHSYGEYQPIRNHRGEVVSIVVYVSDITDLKEAELGLQNMNATKTRLLSIISHDLKSPIKSLQGLLSISQNVTQEEFLGLLDKIGKQVNAVSFTMDNLLNWVRSQLEGFKVNITEVDISDVVKNCVKLYSEEIKAKQIKISNRLNGNVQTKADPDHVKLVVRNILSNAIKFTPKSGTITFDLLMKTEGMELSIVDTGVGMTKNQLNNLFSSKAPISEPGTSGEVGTGLGLSLCADVLLLNGGSLDITSTQGQGTKVTICLPKYS